MHANVNIISQKSEHMLAESFAFRDIEVIKHTQKTFRYIATHGHAYTVHIQAGLCSKRIILTYRPTHSEHMQPLYVLTKKVKSIIKQ